MNDITTGKHQQRWQILLAVVIQRIQTIPSLVYADDDWKQFLMSIWSENVS